MKLCLKNADSVFDGEGERSPEFHEWWEGHQHECQANFEGSSGSMDASGILNIFQRSIESHSMQYVEFLGDGDSKAHKLSMEMSVLKSLNVWATYRSVWVHACVPGKAIRKNTQHNGYAECSDGHLASQQIYQ